MFLLFSCKGGIGAGDSYGSTFAMGNGTGYGHGYGYTDAEGCGGAIGFGQGQNAGYTSLQDNGLEVL